MDGDAAAGDASADAGRGWLFWAALAIMLLTWAGGLYLFLLGRR